LGWPSGGEARISSILPELKVRRVALLTKSKPLTIAFTQAADGLHLTLPRERPGSYAWVFRIDTE
jgi:alpha-L-fucosidase